MKGNIRKLKLILITSTLLLGTLVIGETNSKAALQANSTTHSARKTYTGSALIQSIREMEASGQTMGLTETIGSNLVATSDSNNIDVHMMKATEYGAVAILSASGFGNPKWLQSSDIKSTTGNVTGVYMGNRTEWTAGINSASTIGKNARYYDLYKRDDRTSAKVGDALGRDTYVDSPGCAGWHDAYYLSWLVQEGSFAFIRGGRGIFTYEFAAWKETSYCGRGVAVVGQGL